MMMESDKNRTFQQERIFHKLFAAAEIAKYSREEKELYEESLKYYRDFNNVVDTAFYDDG
jgi:RNA-splicing ligase RtcB